MQGDFFMKTFLRQESSDWLVGTFSFFHSGTEQGEAYMQKTCDVAGKAILAKKKLRTKCVNRDKM